jgi:fructosamine-3-kinase
VHQLHPLLVHTVLFGGAYAAQALEAAERASAL